VERRSWIAPLLEEFRYAGGSLGHRGKPPVMGCPGPSFIGGEWIGKRPPGEISAKKGKLRASRRPGESRRLVRLPNAGHTKPVGVALRQAGFRSVKHTWNDQRPWRPPRNISFAGQSCRSSAGRWCWKKDPSKRNSPIRIPRCCGGGF